MVNLRDLGAVMHMLRDDKLETAAKVVEDALRELIMRRDTIQPPEPLPAPQKLVLH